MNNPGMSRSPQVPTLFRRVGISFLLGFALFILGAILQTVLKGEGITGTSVYVDDLAMGVAAGLLVFAFEQRRSRDIRAKIAVIAAMNHHVRNALQTISYAPYTEQAKQIQLIEDSVYRIQWALREILPGTTELAKPPATATRAVADKARNSKEAS